MGRTYAQHENITLGDPDATHEELDEVERLYIWGIETTTYLGLKDIVVFEHPVRTDPLAQVAQAQPGVARHGGLRSSSNSITNTMIEGRVLVYFDGGLRVRLHDDDLSECVEDRAMLGPERHDGHRGAVRARDEASEAVASYNIGVHRQRGDGRRP